MFRRYGSYFVFHLIYDSIVSLKTAHIFYEKQSFDLSVYALFGVNLSTILIFDFGIVQTMWYFCPHFIR